MQDPWHGGARLALSMKLSLQTKSPGGTGPTSTKTQIPYGLAASGIDCYVHCELKAIQKTLLAERDLNAWLFQLFLTADSQREGVASE